MSSIITNSRKQIKEKSRIISRISTIINSHSAINETDKEFSLSDHIFYLLRASENSDPKIKNKIENHLVKMGINAVPYLVNFLIELKGTTRGLIAMALIRIGYASINPLEQLAINNPELKWVSEYITEEIKGSQIKLNTPSIIDDSLNQALVG